MHDDEMVDRKLAACKARVVEKGADLEVHAAAESRTMELVTR